MPSHINTLVFREKSIETHGEKYDYSQSNYIKSSIKINILNLHKNKFLYLCKYVKKVYYKNKFSNS